MSGNQCRLKFHWLELIFRDTLPSSLRGLETNQNNMAAICTTSKSKIGYNFCRNPLGGSQFHTKVFTFFSAINQGFWPKIWTTLTVSKKVFFTIYGIHSTISNDVLIHRDNGTPNIQVAADHHHADLVLLGWGHNLHGVVQDDVHELVITWPVQELHRCFSPWINNKKTKIENISAVYIYISYM